MPIGLPAAIGATLASLALLLAGAAPARAAWSAPLPIASQGDIGAVATAVDAHGDVAVAWATPPPPPSYAFGTAVHVAVRLASGRVTRRTLWSSHAIADGVSIAVARGEVTVAWVAETPRERFADSGATVRTDYAPLGGRWAPVQAVGHWHDRNPPVLRYPRLAASPDGEVLLVFDESTRSIRGPAAAWRKRGRRFGAPRALLGANRPALLVPHELGPMAAFDARGRAYVWGQCDGIVLTASPHHHGFGDPIRVARAPALSFALSIGGPGRGLASWAHGRCATAEEEVGVPGPVLASVLRAGRFGRPLALTGAATHAIRTGAVALPGGGGEVNWTPYTPPTTTLSTVQVRADGSLGPVLVGGQIPGGLVPVFSDGGGDLVLSSAPGALPGLGGGCVVRPANGGADERAPSPYGLVATAPYGRAVAVAWTASPAVLELASWRP